jgi:hypothetical protein
MSDVWGPDLQADQVVTGLALNSAATKADAVQLKGIAGDILVHRILE